MPPPDLTLLRAVADRLDQLELNYAFVGGAIVNLLLDNPEFLPARPTDDVDVIIEVLTDERYSDLEERIRSLGFEHDMRPGAPRCRWVLGKLTVDIMPTEGAHLGLNTAWFSEALASVEERIFGHVRLKLVSPVGFLATKYTAFMDRGRDDFHGSHDLEDFITVIDGRDEIVAEVRRAPGRLRQYVGQAVRLLVAIEAFNESLPGHLPPDEASQLRLPGLRVKLRRIGEIK